MQLVAKERMIKLFLSGFLSMSAVYNNDAPLGDTISSSSQSVRGLFPASMLTLEQKVSHSANVLHNRDTLTYSASSLSSKSLYRLPLP